jgi:hypothetical protein
VERLRPSTVAIGAVLGGIAVYEYTCDTDELITSRTQELLKDKRTRYLTAGFIGATALHLFGAVPKSVDMYSYLGKLRKYTRPDEKLPPV